ncbi:MAG: YbgC/FadM family acyl-CoA thioesterase [Burkholderiaceae bacterium]|jgi:acyl-CoA thioester hydrolase|nr:YbgC/FadM family acyl-CoA thioesterase [Burkholderiaceae bacterium]
MTFELPIQVFWEDTDAGGIVYYANYLCFFERARTNWLRSLGISQRQLKESIGGMFVVSKCAIQYLHPARIEDELIVSATLQAASAAQLTIAQQARRRGANGAASELLCQSTVHLAWVNAVTLRPARIPGYLIEKMRS